ncbi:hypothetical protein Acsp04_64390 [Actinomadura sp. NBRC 104425]|uniref:hypothetical protein n=1 Tax=Actinomadura sp. NBRC 104425 TaxID=3032204 RepID=UPI0024A299D5|nr:hypothetical protein [Actinomadura sp. NBRC 104425]GLZ16204.1 hypothetical protein Acsp04_64390 [Actinomadura sp. NBRC 104425]
MTDPIVSQYDDDPVDTTPHIGEGDESEEEPPPPDLGNTDSPDLTVWETRPSFNDDPKNSEQSGGGGAPPDSTPAEDFSINLKKVATEVENMLATSRMLVKQYEELRTKVLNTQGTIFGQDAMEDHESFYINYQVYFPSRDEPTESRWAEPARKFAAQMNPAQNKALQHIGGVLELVGEYIALVNHSGQVYAETDRNSRFPAPPPGQVVE